MRLIFDWHSRRKLNHNIRSLKSYFLDYWCAGQLSYEERKVICRLEEVSQKKNSKKLYQFIEKYVEEKIVSRYDITYQKVIYAIRNSRDKVSGQLKSAIEIYFTLFFNGWFASALRDHKQYQKIKKFLGEPFALRESNRPQTFLTVNVEELNEYNRLERRPVIKMASKILYSI